MVGQDGKLHQEPDIAVNAGESLSVLVFLCTTSHHLIFIPIIR